MILTPLAVRSVHKCPMNRALWNILSLPRNSTFRRVIYGQCNCVRNQVLYYKFVRLLTLKSSQNLVQRLIKIEVLCEVYKISRKPPSVSISDFIYLSNFDFRKPSLFFSLSRRPLQYTSGIYGNKHWTLTCLSTYLLWLIQYPSHPDSSFIYSI